MRRITPAAAYEELPCSIVSVGCALGYAHSDEISAITPRGLRSDGYLSLQGMDDLLKANMRVIRRVYYKRGERPRLWDFMRENKGRRAVLCLLGHFVYFDGEDYHSFLKNDGDLVVKAWYVEDKQ